MVGQLKPCDTCGTEYTNSGIPVYVAIKVNEGESEPEIAMCCLHCALTPYWKGATITLLDGTKVDIDLCYINWVLHCITIDKWQKVRR